MYTRTHRFAPKVSTRASLQDYAQKWLDVGSKRWKYYVLLYKFVHFPLNIVLHGIGFKRLIWRQLIAVSDISIYICLLRYHLEANPKNNWMRGEQACLLILPNHGEATRQISNSQSFCQTRWTRVRVAKKKSHQVNPRIKGRWGDFLALSGPLHQVVLICSIPWHFCFGCFTLSCSL